MRRILAVLCVGIVAAGSCGEEPPPPAEPQAEADTSGTPPTGRELLEALGYLDEFEASDDRPSGVLVHRPEAVSPGWNLVSVHRRAHALLFDADGEPLHVWQGPGEVWGHAELLPNGDLLVPERAAGVYDLVRLNWDGEEVWRVNVGAHHDVEVRADGKISTLGFAERQEDAIDPARPFRDECILVLDPETGEELERASFFDLFTNSEPPFPHLEQRWIEKPRKDAEWIDLYHANSVEWMRETALFGSHPLYAADHVLVSFRHQACVALFDWSEKRCLWWWGREEISGSHDATLLPSGNILIFDNGLQRGWSRAVEVDPRTDTIVWEYRAANPEDFWTESRGAAQRLANGNTLLAESDRGHAIEVTAAGEIVWEYYHPGEDAKVATITRIKRIEPALQRALRARFPDLPGAAEVDER